MRKQLKLCAVFKPIIGQFWEDIYLLGYTFEIQYYLRTKIRQIIDLLWLSKSGQLQTVHLSIVSATKLSSFKTMNIDEIHRSVCCNVATMCRSVW